MRLAHAGMERKRRPGHSARAPMGIRGTCLGKRAAAQTCRSSSSSSSRIASAAECGLGGDDNNRVRPRQGAHFPKVGAKRQGPCSPGTRTRTQARIRQQPPSITPRPWIRAADRDSSPAVIHTPAAAVCVYVFSPPPHTRPSWERSATECPRPDLRPLVHPRLSWKFHVERH